MQVIVEEVVSRFRAGKQDTSLSTADLHRLVSHVLEAIEVRQRRDSSLAEELSMHNYQQRTPHGSD